jgi:hypothetical protein
MDMVVKDKGQQSSEADQLTLFSLLGGYERSAAEYRALLEGAGWSYVDKFDGSVMGVVEAVKSS